MEEEDFRVKHDRKFLAYALGLTAVVLALAVISLGVVLYVSP